MLIKRLQTLTQSNSFFLFGARGTGKSTLINQLFNPAYCYGINLLEPAQEELYARNPDDLITIVHALPDYTTHVIIYEIQKIPKLLDIVHILIEEKKKIFILTGSSARKLKRGGANLLAGRKYSFRRFKSSY